jgi:hypothetical protein
MVDQVRQDVGGWISGPGIDSERIWQRDAYNREIDRMTETADKIVYDARDALEQGCIDQATYDRVAEMAVDYTRGTAKMLAVIYKQDVT